MENRDLELGEVGMAQDTAQRLLNEEITTAMENGDLELGDVNMIQGTFQSLVDCIENEVNNMNRSPSIYMAPHTLRELSPSSFKPRMVSIGPLHREDNNLRAFEKHKIIYLNSLMGRTRSRNEILKLCVEKAYSSMDRIKVCYISKKNYDDAEVAKMMVVDACFMLEFIYRYLRPGESSLGNLFLPKTIIFDLVLLENQIPLFFLNEIYQCTMFNITKATLIQFISPVLNDLSLFMENIEITNISINTTPHILSLLHECYKPQIDIESGYISSENYSALDLDRAGVKFKPIQNPKWPIEMNVESYWSPCFSWCWSKPTLRMPILRIHDFTELVLRNLIVYEQQSSQTPNLITSYAFTMDMLVNNQEDVAMLVDSKVLVNNMGSNIEAANMMNSICKEVTQEEFFYYKQWERLNDHCTGYWPKHIASMRKTYFNSPWNIIALFAGIILFALTAVQTVFTINPV